MKKRFHVVLLVLLLLAVVSMFAMEIQADDGPKDPVVDPTEITEEAPSVSYAYDPAAEGILSAYYYVDQARGFLLGIAPRTESSRVCNVCVPANTTLSTEMPATGAILSAPLDNRSLTVIVTGDLNGDGAATITDMLMLKSALLGETLTPEAAAAGDINYDGNVTITDFLRVKSALLGLGTIEAGRPAASDEEGGLLLLTPGAQRGWLPEVPEGVTFVSGDEALVQIDSTGTITALSAEGTAFVYALSADGQLFARSLVTVLSEKMEVSLDKASGSIFPGTTLQLSVTFNHPFVQPVVWSTSDPETATVDQNGLITAHQSGSAVITASLESGSTAEFALQVIPPITSLSIEKSIYKIKPGTTRTLNLVTEPSEVGEVFQWETSDPAIVTVSEDGTVTAVNYGTATVTVRGKYSGLTASCDVKVCDVKQVALTFDDGPSIYTERLLDYLKEHDIKVTFFLVANRIPNFKEEVIREVQEGHEIGYHSYAHDMQTSLTSERITSDFVKSNAMLKELTGAEFTLWRTPGGSYNQRVLDAVELPHILWSLDTLDWKSLNAKDVCSQIKRAGDGSIVLIHDLHRTSVEGAIMALDSMIYGDYEFVTVTELLSRDGTPPENSVNYNSDIR